jgi:hypothetical protein
VKKSSFKRPTYQEALEKARIKTSRAKNAPRKKGLCKTGKQKISVIQRSIWAECKRIIRARYPDICYTCGATNLMTKPANCQTGHLLAKASVGAFLKYDLRVLRIQCYLCNIRHGGRGADFITNMRRIEGDEYVDQILKDKAVTVKAMDHYIKLLSEYKTIEK